MENSYLLVDGYRLDLLEGEPIPITRTIQDITKPTERKKSQSKTFNIVGTQRNMKFFQSAYSLSWRVLEGSPIGLNYDISQLYQAEYYYQGQLTFKGAFQLLNVVIEKGVYQFEVALFSELVSVFQQWGDLKISELDWSEYDHTLNETNIQNSWDTSVIVNSVATSNFTAGVPDGFGYLYAPVDYGFSNVLDKFKDSEIIPQVYFKEIVEKSFEKLGYSVDDTFIGTERFKRLMLGYGGGDKFQLSGADLANLAYDLTGDGTFSDNASATDQGGGLVGIYGLTWFPFETSNSNYSIVIGSDPSSLATTGRVTIPKTGTYRITVAFTLDYTYSFANPAQSTDADISFNYELRFYKNFGYQVVSNDSGAGNLDELTPLTGSYVVNKSFDVFLEAGDEYFLTLRNKATGTYNITPGDIYQPLQMEGDFNNTVVIDQECLNSEIINGSTVYLSSVLPDMKVTDFMKGIINHFGLTISEPDQDQVVYIEPRNTWYEDSSTADNWTKKIDFDQPIEIEPIAINQSKFFKWRFAQDQDYYRSIYRDLFGEGYGDYTYENPSFFAKGETVYDLPYTISPPVERTGSDLIIPRIIEMTNGIVKPFKGKPRIYYFQGLITDAWTLVNSDTLAETAQTDYPALHHLDDTTTPTFDLCFGTPQQVFYTATDYTTDNAYTEYLEEFTLEVTSIDSKLLKAHFWLSEKDSREEVLQRIKNIDGIYYRVNQIKDYVDSRSTMVELTKILDVKKKGTYNLAIGINVKQGQFGTYNSTDTEYGKRTDPLSTNVTVSMENDLYDMDCTGAERTVTLDNRVLRDNYFFSVRKSAGGNNVVISIANGKTLNGYSSVTITQTGTSLRIKWDGTEYTIN